MKDITRYSAITAGGSLLFCYSSIGSEVFKHLMLPIYTKKRKAALLRTKSRMPNEGIALWAIA